MRIAFGQSLGFGRLRGIGASMAVLLVLSGCVQAPPAAPRAPARASLAPVVARPEARVQPASWQFVARPSACIATAASDGGQFVATVEATMVRFAVGGGEFARARRSAQANALVFSGPEGEWRLPAEGSANGAMAAQLGLDEPSVVHVLGLLGGGVVTAERGGASTQQLRLPAGGPQGRRWFECVRRLLLT